MARERDARARRPMPIVLQPFDCIDNCQTGEVDQLWIAGSGKMADSIL
jgi:hypothetical protein